MASIDVERHQRRRGDSNTRWACTHFGFLFQQPIDIPESESGISALHSHRTGAGPKQQVFRSNSANHVTHLRYLMVALLVSLFSTRFLLIMFNSSTTRIFVSLSLVPAFCLLSYGQGVKEFGAPK